MPGSKRRALKKLLSPTSTPPSSSPSNALESSASLTSNPSLASGIDSDATLDEMTTREKGIGAGTSRADDHVPDLHTRAQPTNGNGNGNAGAQAGVYPQQVTAEQLMFGADTAGKGKKKSSKQRFAERQARRQEAMLMSAPPSDPDWNAHLERERQEEIRIIGDACVQLGRAIHEIPPDGHCMYNAIADQLAQIGLLSEQYTADPRYIRQKTAEFMLQNPDDFMPFLPSIQGEDSVGATTHDGVMTKDEFGKYCKLVAETGEWGGEPEIQALSRCFGVPIHVIQSGPPTIVSHGGTNDTFGGGLTPAQSAQQGDRVVRISYHKRMYGLGEHYNSLRKAL